MNGGVPRRPTSPPSIEFFEESRPSCGAAKRRLVLGSIVIELSGLEQSLARAFDDRFGPFAVTVTEDNGDDSDVLRVPVVGDVVDYFIDPPRQPENNPLLLACDGDRVRLVGYRAAGWFEIGGSRGGLVLATGDYEPAAGALENFLRAAVAWQAAARGGALVHAASAVWKGGAYLFYGESGAGKSTLSAVNRRARVVSDDLSLVLPGADGALELIGTPFRGTYEEGPSVVGRFPLRAGFRIVKDREAEVRPVARALAMSEVVGNLPFVAEAFARRPDLFARIESAFSALPLARLHFRKDDSYWDAIERAGL